MSYDPESHTPEKPDAAAPPPSVGVQAVLYNNHFAAIDRALAAIARSRDLALSTGAINEATVHYGDCSPYPCLSEEELGELRRRYGYAIRITYQFFDANLGSARGHNRLAENNNADVILLTNPDIVVSPRLIENMLVGLARQGVGMVEAKQLPIEHPKDYDPLTGETSWGSGACTMILSSLFRKLKGYDADSFFLYCDDVDLSWRVRLAGYKIMFQPAAIAFHDKRLSVDAAWQPSDAERYYSAEGGLLLTHKWSRPDLTEKFLTYFERSDAPELLKAAQEFRRRQTAETLPEPIDANHQIGQFIDGNYAKHRFAL